MRTSQLTLSALPQWSIRRPHTALCPCFRSVMRLVSNLSGFSSNRPPPPC
jgi:hypothetical protein